LTEASVSPDGWPADLDPRRMLLSDIHPGILVRPQTLADTILSPMELEPDLVTIVGDIVTGHSSKVRPYLAALAPLSRPLRGAWYSHGNHDYFGCDADDIRKDLGSVGITTLNNASVAIVHGRGHFVLGAIDDLIFSRPDWPGVLSPHGASRLNCQGWDRPSPRPAVTENGCYVTYDREVIEGAA
jgi:calcineurin-like phosphoesterase family protein